MLGASVHRNEHGAAGVAEGCDLSTLIFSGLKKDQDQKIAAFGSSYGGNQ